MDVAAERTGMAALTILGFAAPAHPCAMYLMRVLKQTTLHCSGTDTLSWFFLRDNNLGDIPLLRDR